MVVRAAGKGVYDGGVEPGVEGRVVMLARAASGAKRFKWIVEVCREGLVEECELRAEECE